MGQGEVRERGKRRSGSGGSEKRGARGVVGQGEVRREGQEA